MLLLQILSLLGTAIVFATPVQYPIIANLEDARQLPRVVSPSLCQDTEHPQYSGYLPHSPFFFWFFPSRGDPSKDPIGVWTNGGPGSSALSGVNIIGPCEIVSGRGSNSTEDLVMKRRDWSFNDHGSILMVDYVLGVGFSNAPFPSHDNIYDSAKDMYAFLIEWYHHFPQYQPNDLVLNGVSYGGHYVPATASYIQHVNLLLSSRPSPWSDIFPRELPMLLSGHKPKHLPLKRVSIGNGWMNSTIQGEANIDFACGGAIDTNVPMLAEQEVCKWARHLWGPAKERVEKCHDRTDCVSNGLYADSISSAPYAFTGLNNYNYHKKGEDDESVTMAFYNNRTNQRVIGSIASREETKKWEVHSDKVHLLFQLSGDWTASTEYLLSRLLGSGISVLKYVGMVDWICNYLGVRQIMANLPGYTQQKQFNSEKMQDWIVGGKRAGSYKCHRAKGEGKLCYVEVDDAGHVISLEKPREGSALIGKWMQGEAVADD